MTHWLRYRWHQFRYRRKGALWLNLHSYGCSACEDR